ncbi:MAG: LruC domain-containing protein [Bacteroidales bacterium]|nr:LruC domain-containing protein [Bacteroidales bacterium]
MKRTVFILSVTIVISLFILPGCKKNPDSNPSGENANVSSMNDLQVPATFNWNMTRDVDLSIGMNFPQNTYRYNTIQVFNGDPDNAGKLVFTGYAGNENPLIAKISLTTAVSSLYLKLIPSNGITHIVEVPVNASISYTFTPQSGVKSTFNANSGPDCSAAVPQFTLSGVLNKTINDGNTYYITGSASGSVDVKKGTLQICGSFSGVINMGDNSNVSTVIIASTGTAVLSSMSKDDNSTLTNYGTLSIADNFTPKVLVENFGTMTVGGQYLMNSGGPHDPSLVNTGVLTINGDFNVHKQLTNNGTIEVMGQMNCNNGQILNACKIITHLNFHLNSCEFTNQSGYLKVYQETDIQGGQAFMKLIDQAMISTYDLRMNGDIIGLGIRNEVKVAHDLRFDGPNVVNGPVEVAQTDGVMVSGDASNFVNGATFVSFANIVNTIPTSACNPEGSNPTPPPITDNYTTGTVVYEDLWPGKGDYDINDLVVYYKYNLQTNTENKVVNIIAKFYVKAAGAGLKNGFGFQIDGLTSSDIGSVTGYSLQEGYVSLNSNGTEANQAHAVIIAWDNTDNVIHSAGSSFFNTLPNAPVGTADTITITVHLATPVLTTILGTAPFNPFLIKGLNRAIEVHLPNYIPTSLVDLSYFGTFDDNSDPGTGRYYKTDKNLPWALNIPVSFDYPFEFIDITQAYNYFAAWAQSGGVLYPDWYGNTIGYRNADKIWHP